MQGLRCSHAAALLLALAVLLPHSSGGNFLLSPSQAPSALYRDLFCELRPSAPPGNGGLLCAMLLLGVALLVHDTRPRSLGTLCRRQHHPRGAESRRAECRGRQRDILHELHRDAAAACPAAAPPCAPALTALPPPAANHPGPQPPITPATGHPAPCSSPTKGSSRSPPMQWAPAWDTNAVCVLRRSEPTSHAPKVYRV